MTEDGDKKEASAAPVKKERPSRKDRKKKDKPKLLTKVVIRRLPPTMNEEDFREQINPIPDHDYFYYVPADWTLGLNSSCRAYINFLKQEDIFIFKEKFDGYVFVDSRGAEYPAVVEFAPFQGLPKNRARKRDIKSNSIDTEAHYLAFLESLKAEGGEKQESKLEYSYQFRDDKKIKSTPLLEFIANKRNEKREEKKRKMEEKRRQRDEEKQRKKNQVAKAIPAAIVEQEKEGEDDIIVRTIKSRTPDKRGKKDKEKPQGEQQKDGRKERPPLDEKAKAAREERDRKRAERDQQRKLERERKKEKAKAQAREAKAANDATTPQTEEVRREVKKYSERRREQRQEKKAETQEKDTKKTEVEKGEKGAEAAGQAKAEEKPAEKSNRQLKREKMREEREKQKEERQARRIRNKDRPSIQIYQPGKSRLSCKKSGSDDQCPEESKGEMPPSEHPPTSTPESPNVAEIANELPNATPSTSDAPKADPVIPTDAPEIPKPATDAPIAATEAPKTAPEDPEID